MKKICVILIYLSISVVFYSQKWVQINQEYFGMKYKLPEKSEVDGFGSDVSEETGSSVCDCAGTINIGNRYEKNEIFMVDHNHLFLGQI